MPSPASTSERTYGSISPDLPMHVAILTPGFAVDETDTNCVPAVQDFLLGLRRASPSIELTVFALRYPHTRQTYEWHGIPVRPANGRQLRFPASLASWARLTASFAGVMRRKPIQVVHSFWLGECAYLGGRLSRLYGVPHIVTLMGREVAVRNPYAGLLKSTHTTFVAVSQFQRDELLKRTGRDVQHVIPWGVEEPRIKAGGMRDIDVLGVGSLTDVKDFSTFLDVLAIVSKETPRLVCRIVGDGPQREMLQAKATRLGLENIVQFEGRLSRERVFELMSRSRVLLHTSAFESFGLVFAEALACGQCIVSKPVGIAEAGPRWAVGEDRDRMALAVIEFLRNTDFTPRIGHPLERTVGAYRNVYRAARGAELVPASAVPRVD